MLLLSARESFSWSLDRGRPRRNFTHTDIGILGIHHRACPAPLFLVHSHGMYREPNSSIMTLALIEAITRQRAAGAATLSSPHRRACGVQELSDAHIVLPSGSNSAGHVISHPISSGRHFGSKADVCWAVTREYMHSSARHALCIKATVRATHPVKGSSKTSLATRRRAGGLARLERRS